MGGPRKPASQGEGGYNLVLFVLMITLLHVAMAVALPLWSQAAKREKEEELIFRGMQYAEAIRVFQQRHGRAPVRLEELIEVKPRSIRQLYPDPMSDDGAWGLLIVGAGGGAQGQGQGRPRRPGRGRQSQDLGRSGSGRIGVFTGRPQGTLIAVPPVRGEHEGGFGRPRSGTVGPIQGVYSAVSEDSVKVFMGNTNYEKWQFHVGLIHLPQILGGDAPLPRANSGLIGRPFPFGLQPQLPNQPPGQSGGVRGRDLTQPTAQPGQRPRGRRRNR